MDTLVCTLIFQMTTVLNADTMKTPGVSYARNHYCHCSTPKGRDSAPQVNSEPLWNALGRGRH